MAKKANIKTLLNKSSSRQVSTDDSRRYIRCRVLIVCEGEKTEPNYFRSFAMMENSHGFVYEIDCDGGKINTVQVVEKAIELSSKKSKEGRPYDSVWAVFDKDSFAAKDFNTAITKAEKHNINCAWSNEAFELWYVFHFKERKTAMSRNEYKKDISRSISDGMNKKGSFVYKKNQTNIREVLKQYGNEERAIKWAEHQAKTFNDKKYSTHNPCTMVYKLVRLLRGEDDAFNKKIKKDIQGR